MQQRNEDKTTARWTLTALLILTLTGGASLMAEDRLLHDFSDAREAGGWMAINDGVMGGVSSGRMTVTDDGTLMFAGHVSLELFRKGLDRPKTRMPKLRYYILAFMLGPGMIPYKLAFTLALLFKPKSEKKKLLSKVDRMLENYRLELEAAGDPRWVTVSSRGRVVAEKVLNPDHISVATGLFFPTYKVLVAALLAIVVTTFAIPNLPLLNPVFAQYPDLSLILTRSI